MTSTKFTAESKAYTAKGFELISASREEGEGAQGVKSCNCEDSCYIGD